MNPILLLAAIAAALLSDTLDRNLNGHGALKRLILILAAGVVLVTALPLLFRLS